MKQSLRPWLHCVMLVALIAIPAEGILSQSAPNRYWVQFEGKEQSELAPGHTTPYSVDEPTAFLSERAIQRRTTQAIDSHRS